MKLALFQRHTDGSIHANQEYITNELQDRNHITTSREAEKALEKKIQYPFIIKTKDEETTHQHYKGYL